VRERSTDLAYASTVLADSAPAPKDDKLIGRTLIGQYVVQKRLADGGMGALYLADQPSVGRAAVIKILSASASRGRERAARFELEARAASRLNHPNIVTIYNYGALDDGTLFLAMEHLEGRSLKQLIEAEAPLPPERALWIARQIGLALAEAHREGVVHRDIKPSNVMMVTRGAERDFVKVLDFGVAKMQGTDLTIAGQLCGTPAYMSPEQCRGRDLDGRSDLYSLAVVLFEMITGTLPFVANTPVGFMGKHLTEPPPHASTHVEVADALDAVLLRALAKDPDERPATLDAFLQELDAAMKPVPVVALAPVAPVAPVSPVAPGRTIELRAGLTGVWSRFTAIIRDLWSSARERLRPRPERPWRKVVRWWHDLPLRRKPTLRKKLRRRGDKLARSFRAWLRRR